MDPLRWQRIGELFAAASRLDSERRIAFLKDNCGQDQDLFEQLKSLLDIDDRHGVLDCTPTVSTLGIPEIVAGRFRIIRRIAEGGMGTVYEAEDLQLGDHVALKTIRPEIASNLRAVERFRQEIRLGKRVTHPNICRIYDLGTDRSENGSEFLFLTMQFLDGETLSSRIRRGPVPQREALPLIEDMADALSAAHQAEVIHRDFKSGNVILVPCARRTCAVVTDFGLARGINDGASLTRSGLVGTVDYMAPEQIIGGEITPATDIYALGVVMYEMVTGQLPFTRDCKGTVVQKHLNDEPRPPRDLVPQLDANWNEAILGCLRKLPGDRFQSGTELKAAVAVKPSMRTKSRLLPSASGALAIGASVVAVILLAFAGWIWKNHPHKTQPGPRILAVLPFRALTGGESTTALGAGMTETLTAELAQVSDRDTLQLVSMHEIEAQEIKTAEQARRDFGVDLVLEGSLQQEGSELRINCSLVDAKTNRQIGACTITASVGDIFGLQDQVVTEALRILAVEAESDKQAKLQSHPDTKPVAYEHYLRGLGYLQEYHKPENIQSAIAELGLAQQFDPNYAHAYAAMGNAYWLGFLESNRTNKWIDKAAENCGKALAINPGFSDGHSCMGNVYNGRGEYNKAADEFKRAVGLDGTSDTAFRGLADAYEKLGDVHSAEATYKQAIALRPQYWAGYNRLGGFYFHQARFADAIRAFQRATALAPENFEAYTNLGGALSADGNFAEAIKVLQRSLDIRPTLEAYSNIGTAYFALRKFGDAAQMYQQGLKLDDRDSMIWGNLGDALYWTPDRRSEAAAAYRKAISLAQAKLQVNPRDANLLAFVATYKAMTGEKDAAIADVQQAIALAPEDPDVRFRAALVYNHFGDAERTVASLEKAVAAGYPAAAIRETPDFDHLRDDARIQALLGKL